MVLRIQTHTNYEAISIVLLPRKHQFKIGDQCVVPIKGIMLTPKEVPPLGELGYKPWPPVADTATAQGVANPADLLLEGRGAAAQAAEPPESPVFCGAKNAPK
jgi:hypothetical protein